MPNLIANGSFEDNVDGWIPGFLTTLSVAPDGKSGSCMAVTRNPDGFNQQEAMLMLTVEPNALYHYQVWLRGAAGETGHLSLWSGAGFEEEFEFAEEWTLHSGDFSTSEEQVVAQLVLFRMSDDPGQFYVDECWVWKDGESGPEPEPEALPTAGDKTFTASVTLSGGDSAQQTTLLAAALQKIASMVAMCGASQATVISAAIADGTLTFVIRLNGYAAEGNQWVILLTAIKKYIADVDGQLGEASLKFGTITGE